MGTETVEKDTREEEDGNEEKAEFESQVSLNSSTLENEASTNMENGHSEQFGAARTINDTIDWNTIRQLREFMTTTKSGVQSEITSVTRSGTTSVETHADYEIASNPRGRTRISNITKLPGTN